MATDLANLQEARTNAIAKLTAALQGDYSAALELKPNFGGANGVDRIGYVNALKDTIAFLDKEINKHNVFEYTSEYTV